MPEADLLPALPQLLGPLLAMVADPNRELRQAVLKTLQVATPSCLPAFVGSALVAPLAGKLNFAGDFAAQSRYSMLCDRWCSAWLALATISSSPSGVV